MKLAKFPIALKDCEWVSEESDLGLHISIAPSSWPIVAWATGNIALGVGWDEKVL